MGYQYFGTDGIRGKVGGDRINPEFFQKLGWAAGRALITEGCQRVVIGKDTRSSGYMLESALEAGFSAAGMDVCLTGPMPTPGVAWLTRTLHACAGVVISASHNPHHDNGIKLFSSRGYKLSDETEHRIEKLIDEPMQVVDSAHLGRASRVEAAAERYMEYCKASVFNAFDLRGKKIVIDCAHGAAYHVAPDVFSELGAEVISIGVAPDGVNINEGCGATDLSALRQKVIAVGADLGIALDGDADRVMMVDHQGRILDGDHIVFMIAHARQQAGLIKGPVVGTQMSNMGLEIALQKSGLRFVREGVGDRHVIHRLLQDDGIVGGEPSGHIICLDKTTTGDGIIAALQVLEAMFDRQVTLAELAAPMKKFPQVLINVPVSNMLRPDDLRHADDMVHEAERGLGEQGRILLRPSGTEPLVRVMVEGSDEVQIKAVGQKLADQVAGFL